MGDQARGSSEENPKIIRRWVSTPIGFEVLVEMTDLGVVDAVGLCYMGVRDSDDHFALTRAFAFVLKALEEAEDMAELAADIMARLPAGAIADIERAILAEVAALQTLRLPKVLGDRHG